MGVDSLAGAGVVVSGTGATGTGAGVEVSGVFVTSGPFFVDCLSPRADVIERSQDCQPVPEGFILLLVAALYRLEKLRLFCRRTLLINGFSVKLVAVKQAGQLFASPNGLRARLSWRE